MVCGPEPNPTQFQNWNSNFLDFFVPGKQSLEPEVKGQVTASFRLGYLEPELEPELVLILRTGTRTGNWIVLMNYEPEPDPEFQLHGTGTILNFVEEQEPEVVLKSEELPKRLVLTWAIPALYQY